MRIAVACTGLSVAPRYEKCESFMCYLIDHGVITGCQNVPNLSTSVNDMFETITALDVQTLLVDTINYDVASSFCDAGIELIAGVKGTAREAVEQYLSQTLLCASSLCEDDLFEDDDVIDVSCPYDLDDLQASLFDDEDVTV